MDKKPFRTTRMTAALRQGRNDWYRISNAAPGVPAQVMIYDEIGWFGVTAQDFVNDLAGVKGDIEVHLNCPGGDVFDGVAIYNALKPRNPRVVVDGLAASAASFIAQAAAPGELHIAKNATLMIHDAFSMGIGNAADLRELADLLDQQSDNIASIYAERSGMPVAHWRDAMRGESWYVGQAAVDAGLADALAGEPAQAARLAAVFDLSVFRNAPAKPSPVDPDGDGDDDSSPETDTDHDYWDEDGNQIQDLPGRPMPQPENRRGGRPAGSAPADTGAGHTLLNWDGPAAMSAAAKSDDPAKAYAAICAGRRAGEPGKQSSWALPHHAHPGDGPDGDGVRNALSRLPQTQGLTNEEAAKAHLEAHLSALGGESGGSNRAAPFLADDEIDNLFAALKEAQ
jgi:ATP-dependent protease ClpP protease subunit